MPRQGNNPKRRIADANLLGPDDRQELAKNLRYVGSAHHKRSPGDYGFHPPVNPRPHKSLCDLLRQINIEEAQALICQGVLKGMFSEYRINGQPKYIWAVDENGEAYEAKVGTGGYHGYRLEKDDDMRRLVLAEWAKR